MQYLVTVTIPDEAIQRLEAEYGADVTAGDIAIWLTESIEQTNESKIAGGFTAEARLVPSMTDVDRTRFTDHEWDLYLAGKCSYQTAYGLPWLKWCEQPSRSNHPLGYCIEHDEEDR